MLGKEGVWWLYYKQNEGENFIAPNVTVIQYCPKALNVIVNLFKKDNVILNDIGAKFSFMFYFLSKGNFKIYYAKDNVTGEIVFHSVVYGKSFKFRFMRKDDYQIAHCFTRETHRGKNIYPYVLKYITKKEKGNAVMFIKDGNKASEHGVVKAGFAKYGGYSKEFFKNILYVEKIKFFTTEELVVKRKTDQIFRSNISQ